MIVEWYPNPKTVEKLLPHKQQQQQYPSPSDLAKAQQRGLTVHEYNKRRVAVTNEFQKYQAAGLHTHMPVVPIQEDKAKEYGTCTVSGVCWDYDLYGDVEWHDPPFILQIRTSTGQFINCTVGYVKPAESLTC